MVIETLCERCRGLPVRPHDLSAATSELPTISTGLDDPSLRTWPRHIGNIEHLQPYHCAFCLLLHESLSNAGKDYTKFSLSTSVECLIRIDSTMIPLLLLEFTRDENRSDEWLSLLQTHSTQSPDHVNLKQASPINPGKVDWEAVKAWLRDCDATHTGCTSHGSDEQQLQGFKVIDCETQDIIPLPPRCRYATLSYVWGLPGPAPDNSLVQPKAQAPQTIKDSMMCTLALGMRYLWIDRYCIDQDDPDTKHRLIQRMDQVYRNSAINIINAAGEGPDCGLSGVSDRTRGKQELVDVHCVRYSTLPCPKQELAQSSWAKRGWTYQEGLLSRRRIVFTQRQIYFQCLQTYGCEAIPGIYKLRVINEDSSMQAFPVLVNAPSEGSELDLSSRKTWIGLRINEYLKRALSYESDIMNAFMGMLRQAWFSPEPVYHFWGLPFFSHTTGDEPIDADLLQALIWIAELDRPTSAELYQPNLVSRRSGFPSWTWAGWRGLSGFRQSRALRLEGGIALEDLAHNRLTLQEYICRMRISWNLLMFKPVLYVTGWFATIHIDLKNWSTGITTGIDDANNKFQFNRVHFIDRAVPLEASTQEGSQSPATECPITMIMFTNKKGQADNRHGGDANTYGLFLTETLEGHYEKVGVFDLDVYHLHLAFAHEVRHTLGEIFEFKVRAQIKPSKIRPRWDEQFTGRLKAEWQTLKLV
ncbi:hypothetical protein HBH64_156120 [Parastagonospora nodorum]|nr:hypothetical protein HBI06_153990 [Parastagonospora nodorum]KAH4239421.1 hypothetical protein HBI05_116370 [Parastagonospora nodorum]KAH4295814.1 hypothetical protein HBI01_153780 [Parastagonospora nodorum]KAH4297956.1 hypothetical protein HBI02_159160 [Parastagonospora nodorum]KAH4326348.1 hypothetical protein HBI00_144650 [Parastagonospora nodorum]